MEIPLFQAATISMEVQNRQNWTGGETTGGKATGRGTEPDKYRQIDRHTEIQTGKQTER